MKKDMKNEKLNTTVNDANDQKPKKSKKKSIILYCSIGIPLTALVIGGGVILGRELGNKAFYQDPYANVDANKLNDDYSSVYAAYEKTNPNSYYNKFTNVELVNIALLNLNHVENFYSITTGSVLAAGVKQNIAATYMKNGDRYFEETITSSSIVKGANRFYQDGDTTSWYKGKYVNSTQGDYTKATPKSYDNEAFEEEWGRQMSRACIYSINDYTCLDSSISDNGNGTKSIELNLDPSLSVVRYTKQMVNTGGLSEKPIFHSVKLKFTVDQNVKLLTFETDEVYDVHMVIDAKNSKGAITQEYVYEERTIPQYNENANYTK